VSELRWPDSYIKTERSDEPNWGWLILWDQSNPAPGTDEGFASWWADRQLLADRVWVAWCLPQFQVFDWPDEDVATARGLMSGHVCGVCGRPDDAGCVLGC